MLTHNVMQVVRKIEREFLPDKYRIVIKLSEEEIYHHKWPDQMIWTRGDGCKFRDMHNLIVNYRAIEKFDEESVLIDAFWSALINNFEGKVGEFCGPVPSGEWRQAFLHYHAVFVKFEKAVSFGSLGILKNDVWNFRDINGEECKSVEQVVS